MHRFIAFLRAINVGGHTVKMADLRAHFEALGFSSVETFIASGNVIFDSRGLDARELEDRIERHLRQSLGYDVATFVRSPEELAGIAGCRPFPDADLAAAGSTLYIALLREPPGVAEQQRLMAFRTDVDAFHARGREIYWLCRTRMGESTFSAALLERTLGMPATMRNATTIRKLASKYCGGD